MKSKPIGSLFALLALTILGIAPAYGQYAPDQSIGSVVAGVMAYNATASDGTLVVVRTSHPISGQPLSIGIGFFNTARNNIQHQNYAITVTQDNNIVLSNLHGHTHTGIDTQTTSVLQSSNPVSIQITLNGIGFPTTDPSTWTGVKGEVLNFGQVAQATTTPLMTSIQNMTNATTTPAVPEFGSIAPIVLAIAVMSIVVFAAKNRVTPKL